MSDKWKLRIVRWLPRWVRYWSAIDVIAHAISGQYGTTDVAALTAMDALKRWEQPPLPPR